MLDIFSNVFGKSKKSTNGKGSSDKDETSSLDKSSNLYPSILLTDQMLKGDNSNTPPGFEIVENPTSSNSAPFSSNDSASISSMSNRQKTSFSPLDNIPFAINSSNNEGAENSLNDLHDCFNLLNSVAGYLASNSSEHQYKFTLEKSMVFIN